MDNDTMMLLARFTIQARKLVGAIDSNLLITDENYRTSIFQKIDATAEEDLLMLSLALRNKLGALDASQAVEEEPEKTGTSADRYKFGARG